MTMGTFVYDCFICHASEDKRLFVDELARKLRSGGCNVWYDDLVLKVGDSLHGKIDEGLLKSRFGVVVLSPSFFQKDWPQKELDGLAALARERGILPVWLNVAKKDVLRFSPLLAGILAAKAVNGMDAVVAQLLDAMGKPAAAAYSYVQAATVTPKQIRSGQAQERAEGRERPKKRRSSNKELWVAVLVFVVLAILCFSAFRSFWGGC